MDECEDLLFGKRIAQLSAVLACRKIKEPNPGCFKEA